ncbi:MAG: transporter substrate-binding domain-containing protein [Desulfomonilaceae bacterium]|nr:transporter substrate-binding domain-containing protein [Desulfomonilaceae bacterium]
MTIKHVGMMAVLVSVACLSAASPHVVSAREAASATTISFSSEEQEWIRNHKTIRLGIDPNWPPIEFAGKGGVHQGISSEVVRIVAQRTGLRMEVVPGLTWPEALAKAKKGEIDVLPCIAKTEDREGYLLFTRPYLNVPVVLVTRTDAAYIGGIDDLHRETVAVIEDYQIHELMRRQHPEVRLLVVGSAREALERVSRGEAFAFAGNLATTSYLIPKLGITNLKVAAPTPYSYVISFGVRKDRPELVSILNKALETITRTERTEMAQRWISLGAYGIDYALVLKGAGIAAVIVLVILAWNFQIRRQREALRKSEERLQAIMDGIPNVVFVTDLAGKKVLVNNEWERVTELTRSASIGKSYRDLFRPELADKLREYDKRVAESLQPFRTEETQVTGTGERTYIYNLVPLLDSQGNPYAICGTTTDITERKQAEEQLERAFAKSNQHLAEAAQYVKSLLPRSISRGPVRTDWRFVPSTALGGDCLGYHWLDTDRFAVYLVDVSGHGVSAALLAVTVTNVLRSRSLKNVDFACPDQVLSSLNNTFPMEEQNDMYFTIWYGVLSLSTRILTYSSGGHPPALLLNDKPGGEKRVERLRTENLFVGGMPGVDFTIAHAEVPESSRLYLYSDGVYEIEREDGTLWGLDDFELFMTGSLSNNGPVLDSLLTHVRELARAETLEDDLSILEVAID